MIIVRPPRHPGVSISVEKSTINARSGGHKNQTQICPKEGPEIAQLIWWASPIELVLSSWLHSCANLESDPMDDFRVAIRVPLSQGQLAQTGDENANSHPLSSSVPRTAETPSKKSRLYS